MKTYIVEVVVPIEIQGFPSPTLGLIVKLPRSVHPIKHMAVKVKGYNDGNKNN